MKIILRRIIIKNNIIEYLIQENYNYFLGDSCKFINFNNPINEFGYSIDKNNFNEKKIYFYNNYGFRSDNFSNNLKGKHILFSGCSETEGIGNLYENVWAKQLYEKIKLNENLAGYFNLGKHALSTPSIIKNIFKYFSMFGYPDVIFLILPDSNRFFSWSNKENLYTMNFSVSNIKDYNSKNINFKKENYNEVNKIKKINDFFAKMMLLILHDFCKSNNIKFFWSSFSEQEYKNFIYVNKIDSFVYINDFNKHIMPKYDTLSHYEITAEDGMHLGTAYHTMWADIFYENYIKN